MTIGRIMDYIEARLEAIKSREEEEDEDEEKEREKERERERNLASGLAKAPLNTPSTSKSATAQLRQRDYVCTLPQHGSCLINVRLEGLLCADDTSDTADTVHAHFRILPPASCIDPAIAAIRVSPTANTLFPAPWF